MKINYLLVALLGFICSSLYAEELRIFNLDQAKTSKSSFIDISDWRVIPEDALQDSIKFRPSKRYRLMNNKEKENDFDYHKLTYKKSENILKLSNIKLSDKIYIYNLKTDKVTSFKVKNTLPLLTHQDPYTSGEEGVDYYYGFEINNLNFPIKADDYRDTYLVYIGKKNPFNTNKMDKIIWKKVSNDRFPINRFTHTHDLQNLEESFEKHEYSDGNPYYIKTSYEQDSYTFTKDNVNYFLYWFTRNEETLDDNSSNSRFSEYSYFFQARKKDESIIFERLVKNHEGFLISPFEEEATSQWVGKLFKSLPPVLFNSHESYSFGCNAIYIMDKNHDPISILCNNRH